MMIYDLVYDTNGNVVDARVIQSKTGEKFVKSKMPEKGLTIGDSFYFRATDL